MAPIQTLILGCEDEVHLTQQSLCQARCSTKHNSTSLILAQHHSSMWDNPLQACTCPKQLRQCTSTITHLHSHRNTSRELLPNGLDDTQAYIMVYGPWYQTVRKTRTNTHTFQTRTHCTCAHARTHTVQLCTCPNTYTQCTSTITHLPSHINTSLEVALNL